METEQKDGILSPPGKSEISAGAVPEGACRGLAPGHLPGSSSGSYSSAPIGVSLYQKKKRSQAVIKNVGQCFRKLHEKKHHKYF